MNKSFVFSLVTCFACLSIASGNGQDIFSGAGIRTSQPQAKKGGWLFGQRDQTAQDSGIKMPWGKNESPESIDSESSSWMGWKKPNWMQPRDPNAPTMFQQANERSRAFWNRTNEGMADFAQRTGESFRTMNRNMRQATTDSWERITGANPRKSDAGDGYVKPPVRSADNWLDKNKDR